MQTIKGGITAPAGFRANGINCGIKNRKPDLAIVFSDVRCRAAGVFTTNRVQAAPVIVSRRHLKRGWARAIIANSGCANCCTGKKGERDALVMAGAVAAALKIEPADVVVASTGKIGKPLEIEKIKTAVARLAAGLSRKRGGACARAIMTTDTVPKETAARVRIGGVPVTIGGIAKGAGMISPRMATMFAFFTTDANISIAALKAALGRAAEGSFNRITVDGDMSTNDTMVILAGGLAGNRRIEKTGRDFGIFARALEEVAAALAKMIVRDGEGADKFVEVEVRGARSAREARMVARRIANSNLLKSTIYGEEPNWGRIAAAAGSAGVDFRQKNLRIYFGGNLVLKNGAAAAVDRGRLLRAARRRELKLAVDLGSGRETAVIWTCDLTPEYVRINAV